MTTTTASRSIPVATSPFRILVVPGDGIGREVIPAALELLRATGLPFEFVPAEAGWECFQRHGASLPDACPISLGLFSRVTAASRRCPTLNPQPSSGGTPLPL